MEKERLVYELVKTREKLGTSYGVLSLCKLYELSKETLKAIYKEVKTKLSELEGDDPFGELDTETQKEKEKLQKWVEVIKVVAQDIKEEEDKRKKEAEIRLIQQKLKQVIAEKQEEELKKLSTDELMELQRLIEQGFSLEEALRKLKEKETQENQN